MAWAIKLPNADYAQVPMEKLRDYLLAPNHPVGSSKARFFHAIGFDQSNLLVLSEALLQIARSCSVHRAVSTNYGTKYIVDGIAVSPTGKQVRLDSLDSREESLLSTVHNCVPVVKWLRSPHMFQELDTVVLTRDVPEHGLTAGDAGAIVHRYADSDACEVEFVTGEGKTIAVLMLTERDLRSIGSGEILHARQLAPA